MVCRYTVESGVYILGALAPADRAAYERHLATCPYCRAELAELARLPGLLGRLDPGTAASVVTPVDTTRARPALLDPVLRRARQERRARAARRRWQFAGAALAAACLAAIVGLGVPMVDRPRPAGPVVAVMRPIDPDLPVTAVLAYRADGGDTVIHMVCMYREEPGYPGTAWNVRLKVYPRGGGQPYATQTWPVRAGSDVQRDERVAGMTPDKIARIDLITDAGTRLLVYEPR